MGSFLSIQTGDKQRRSNRLSKPPSTFTSRSASCRSSRQTSSANSPVAPNLAPLQDPSTATSAPISSPDLESNDRRPQSFPSLSLQSEVSWAGFDGSEKRQTISEESNELCLRSGTWGPFPRRASFQPFRQTTFQPTTLRSEPGQPKRSYSLHSAPNSTRSVVHQNGLEEATSSNTHFMIDSPGFSLIRRRSLLTRPGIATRRSLRDAAHRYPSSIGQEFESSFNRAGESNQPFQWPLTNCDDTVLDHTDPLAQIRPSTPTDFEYTHLGALKLGSLRVVNGSASPCPSDHSWLRPCSPTAEVSTTHIKDIRQGRDHLAQIDPTGMAESNPSGRRNHCSVLEDSWGTGAMPVSMYSGPGRSSNRTSSNNGNVRRPFKSKPSTSILRIPPFTAIMKHEDYPASPFSFEKSPTIAMSHGIYSTEAEDEAISVSDDEIPLDSQRTGSQEGPSLKRSPHSHRKVDSGYSSAASVRSLQDSHTRVSMDSQESAQRPCRYRRFTLGGSKDPDMCNVQSQSELSNQLPANRHLSLQGPRTGPRSGSNSWKTNMSTMCHEKEQLWAGERPRSLSVASPQDSGRMLPLPRYCAELRHYGSASYDAPLLSVHRPGTAAIQISGDTISNIQPCESLTAHKPGSGCGINTTGCKGLEATNRWITGADLGSDLFHKINPPRSKSTKESLKNTLHVRYDEDPEAVGASAAVQCLESEIEALLVPTSQVP